MKPKCPNVFNITFARRLLQYFGADVSQIDDDDCWEDLAKKYPEYRARAEDYFASVKTGNVGRAAYHMHRRCGSSRKWAEGVIAAANDGENACWIHFYCGSSRKWAEGVISAANDGENAYWMHRHCGSSREWAERVKKRSNK